MIIRNGTVCTSDFTFKKKDMLIENDTIAGLQDPVNQESHPELAHESRQVIDAEGLYVLPGFVDIHTHGVNGYDFSHSESFDLDAMSRFYASKGVTSFLATTTTIDRPTLLTALKVLGQVQPGSLSGAKLAGIHMEGPFLSCHACGAQPKEHMQKPDAETFKEYYRASQGTVRHLTLAPELEGAGDLIRCALSLGVTCSAGHTRATYQQALDAIKTGISHLTHTFNAMAGYHHREPGILGAFFDSSHATVEFIGDLIHLHPSVIRTLYRIKGAGHMAAITDSMAATGMKDGVYKLGTQTVYTKDGAATLEDGTLAGSTLTMDLALRNLVKKVGIPLEDAVKMLTYTPSRVFGAEKIGVLQPEYKADLVILDRELHVLYTVVDGKVVYRA